MIAEPRPDRNCVQIVPRSGWTPASVISDNDRMFPAPSSTPMACSGGPLSAIDADLLIVPWFEGEAADAVPDLDAATGGEFGRALASKEFSGQAVRAVSGAARRSELARAPRRRHRRRRRRARDRAWCASWPPPPAWPRGSAESRARRSSVRGHGDRGRACAGGRRRADARRSSTAAATRPTIRRRPPCAAWTVVAHRRCRRRARAGELGASRAAGFSASAATSRASSPNEPGNVLPPREFARRAAALAERGRHQDRDPRRGADREAGHGPAPRRGARAAPSRRA